MAKGGKLSVFQTGMPTYGLGLLKPRDIQKILGTDQEKQLFESQEYFWKKLGQECAVNGVNVDTYFFPRDYIDLATLGAVSSLSGGDCFLYSQFDANYHGVKFANDLQRNLNRTFGYDSLLRVRVSTGFYLHNCRIKSH
jgi:protein transport protein SEC24